VKAFDQFLAKTEISRASGHANRPRQNVAIHQGTTRTPVRHLNHKETPLFAMDSQLTDALADILANALLADIETEMEEEQAVAVSTAQSPTGIGRRKDQDEPLAVSSLAPATAHSSTSNDPIVARV
jgi:hypothetical protein